MTTTFSLKITQIDCIPYQNDQTDVVFKVHWSYTGTNEDNRSAGYGGTTAIPHVTGESFIPYDQLTEQQVVDWVLNAWTPEQLNFYRGVIESQLNIKTAPIPWV